MSALRVLAVLRSARHGGDGGVDVAAMEYQAITVTEHGATRRWHRYPILEFSFGDGTEPDYLIVDTGRLDSRVHKISNWVAIVGVNTADEEIQAMLARRA